MPTTEWLKKQFDYGYDSGNILAFFPNKIRRREEQIIGGSLRKVFFKAVHPYLQKDSVVLELGPGKGAWSRAILSFIPQGTLHVVDFQDVHSWLDVKQYPNRLVTHQVVDNSFSCLDDQTFDFFWSFGVLCHNNVNHIEEILKNAIQKMKPGAFSVHQYADWEKLEAFGWGEKSNIPENFKTQPDDEIWWPRNSQHIMTEIAERAGWTVLEADLDLVKRDSIILLQKS